MLLTARCSPQSDTYSKSDAEAELGPPELSLVIQRKTWPRLLLVGYLVLFIGAVVALSISLGKGAESVADPEESSFDTSRFGESMNYMARMRNLTVDALALNEHALSWYHLDDVVMGGHSTSAVSATVTGGLRFVGNISTRDGGFSSCFTLEQPLGLTAST